MIWFIITYVQFYTISHAAHFSSWKWTNFDKEFRSNLFSWGNTHLVFWSYRLLKYIQSFFSVGTSLSLFLVFLPYSFFYFPRPFYFLSYCYSLNGNPEVAIQSCSQEKLFWNYAANLQENTFAEVTLQLYWNRTSVWEFSCKLDAYFQNTFFKNISGRLLLVISFFVLFVDIIRI